MQNIDFGVELLGLENSRQFQVKISRGFSLDTMYKSRDRDINFLYFQHYLDIVIVLNIV